MSNDVENAALLSDIVWTPERGEADPEVRSLVWNQFLLGDEPYFGRRNTSSDVPVTPDNAILSSCVLACCRILAETISVMPLHVYRRLPDGGKEVAREIPLYKILSFSPNSWQTKMEFFEQMMMNLCLWGNSYTQIVSGRYGSVTELINLHPSRMQVERLENGRLRYSYTNPETGRMERYTQDSVMHIRWTPEPDGIKGMVPIEVAREAIGLARAMEIHAGKFWANSARPGMVLQTDSSLSAEAAERLRDNWERLHRGSDRSNRTAILTNGLKVESVGFSAEQSQFEASRRFQCEEIARCYRIPLHLLQGTSGGSLEVLGQEFVTYTLLPWIRRIESAISRSLIYNDDLFYAEFDVKGLLRGDSNSRMAFYTAALNAGLMTLNECRRAEGLPPIVSKEMPDLGDKHLIAMNLQPLEQALAPKQDPMAAMMGGGGPPPPAQGGVPSLPGVKTGQPPLEAELGEKSEKKPPKISENSAVSWDGGKKLGIVKHVMDQGTLDLKSGEKIEVQPGEPVALVVDPEGNEFGIKVADLSVVEKRSNDCGANDPGGGGFQPGNTCAAGGGGGGGGDISKRISGGESPSSILKQAGFKKMNFTGMDKRAAKMGSKDREKLAAAVHSLVEASKLDPSIRSLKIRIGTPKTTFGEAGSQFDGMDAGYDEVSNSFFINQDWATESARIESRKEGWSASDHPAYVVLHEKAHHDHDMAYKSGEGNPEERHDRITKIAAREVRRNPSLKDKIASVSEYATTDPFEAVAEYTAAVQTGAMKSDPDLDSFCRAVGAKPPKRLVK